MLGSEHHESGTLVKAFIIAEYCCTLPLLQVLNIILSMERLHRIVEFSSEVSCTAANALDLALPGASAVAVAAGQDQGGLVADLVQLPQCAGNTWHLDLPS